MLQDVCRTIRIHRLVLQLFSVEKAFDISLPASAKSGGSFARRLIAGTLILLISELLLFSDTGESKFVSVLVCSSLYVVCEACNRKNFGLLLSYLVILLLLLIFVITIIIIMLLLFLLLLYYSIILILFQMPETAER